MLDVDMPTPWARRWDRREGAHAYDCGWIGEDAEGIWMRRHPIAELVRHPVLWDSITACQAGCIAVDDVMMRDSSNIEIEVRLIYGAARDREESRRSKGGD